MKINKKNTSKWFDYKGTAKLQIHIPNMFNYSPPDENLSFKERYKIIWNMFDECLIGWSGIVDEDDAPVEFNDENKRLLFQYDSGIGSFVVDNAVKLSEKIISTEEVKN